MTQDNKKNIAYILRGVVAVLFLVSAVAKLYDSPYRAITTFEMKQLVPMGFSEGVAQILSRLLIGVEFALGFLILQPHFLRKVVIPATIALLAVFIAQLGIEIGLNGNAGNCGCFGELLPMTPIEAIVKNIIAIGLLAGILILLKGVPDKRNPWVLVGVTALCIAGVVIAVQVTKGTSKTGVVVYDEPIDTTSQVKDSITTPALPATTETPVINATTNTPAEADKPAQDAGPAAVKSPYSQYFPQADKGKKIIGLFAPGCEHCRETAKQLTEMKAKDKNFPDLYIIFMDEEADLIPEFFKIAGKQYPYTVLEVGTFWKLLGMKNDTPGVIYQYNGNKIKEWDGINERKFVAAELQKALKK